MFEKANQAISTKSKGVYHGNNQSARGMAYAFSGKIKRVDEAVFAGGHESGGLVSGKDFLVFCQENDDSIVFLVRVPELDQYHDEVRQVLLALTWQVAVEVVQEHPNSQNVEIAVGLRSLYIYGASAIGRIDDTPEYDAGPRIKRGRFYKYFRSSDSTLEENSLGKADS